MVMEKQRSWPLRTPGTPEECSECHEVFGSHSAYLKHRIPVNKHDQRRPRCMTPDEMYEAGLGEGYAGMWRVNGYGERTGNREWKTRTSDGAW